MAFPILEVLDLTWIYKWERGTYRSGGLPTGESLQRFKSMPEESPVNKNLSLLSQFSTIFRQTLNWEFLSPKRGDSSGKLDCLIGTGRQFYADTFMTNNCGRACGIGWLPPGVSRPNRLPFNVGNGARNLQDTIMRASRESLLLHGAFQQAFGVGRQVAVGSDLTGAHLRVAEDSLVGDAKRLAWRSRAARPGRESQPSLRRRSPT